MPLHRRLPLLAACALALAGWCAPAQGAVPVRRPPVTWLKGEGNYTKAHRAPRSIRAIVVHVTEGSFWSSVDWLKNEQAHASSHYVVARSGKIVQLVHLSDIAWHAGNWRTNTQSVGIEHEGFTYDPVGFTTAQYRASARLAAYIARRALMPIDRAHVIGHAQVPAPGGGYGGAGHHTDPGPHWRWDAYLRLVRRYAFPLPPLRVAPRLVRGPLHGIVPWRARTSGGASRVEFVVDGRVLWSDRRAPFAFAGGRGLNTVNLENGRHVVELRAYGRGNRRAVSRRVVVVRNRVFALTTAGARQWGKVRGVVDLRVRVWGAKARTVVARVDGDRLRADARPPFRFRWDTRLRRDGRHVVTLAARSVDGRLARRRIVVVVANRGRPAAGTLRITGGSLADGQAVSGFVVWRADVEGRAAKVEFWVDGVLRGADLQRPYTIGWDASPEAPGEHLLVVKAIGPDGRVVERALTVAVTPPA